MIRGSGSSQPAFHLFTTFQGDVRSLKNGCTQPLKLPVSTRISVKPPYKEIQAGTMNCGFCGPKARLAESEMEVGLAEGNVILDFLEVCNYC